MPSGASGPARTAFASPPVPVEGCGGGCKAGGCAGGGGGGGYE